jgi:hypothetical protein
MKCKSVIVYYSKGKAVAFTPVTESNEKPEVPAEFTGLKFAKTSFARAYVRFPHIRERWNADGTPMERRGEPVRVSFRKGPAG